VTLAYKEFTKPQSPEAETLRRRKKLRFRDPRAHGVHEAAESRGGDSAEKEVGAAESLACAEASASRRGGDCAEKKALGTQRI